MKEPANKAEADKALKALALKNGRCDNMLTKEGKPKRIYSNRRDVLRAIFCLRMIFGDVGHAWVPCQNHYHVGTVSPTGKRGTQHVYFGEGRNPARKQRKRQTRRRNIQIRKLFKQVGGYGCLLPLIYPPKPPKTKLGHTEKKVHAK